MMVKLRTLEGIRKRDSSIREQRRIVLDHGDAEAVEITSSKGTTRVGVRARDDTLGRNKAQIERIELGLRLEMPVELLVHITWSELADGLDLGFLQRHRTIRARAQAVARWKLKSTNRRWQIRTNAGSRGQDRSTFLHAQLNLCQLLLETRDCSRTSGCSPR